jgi:hypothetical protein
MTLFTAVFGDDIDSNAETDARLSAFESFG